MLPADGSARLSPRLLSAVLALSAVAAAAQDGAREPLGRLITLTPQVSIQETLTDNARFVPTGKESDAITMLSAGLQARSQSPGLRGFLDYSLDSLHYARSSDLNETQNRLNAAASLRLVEERAYVDFGGLITSQPVSVFGTRPPVGGLADPNFEEVRSYSIAPRLEGSLGRIADYRARLGYAASSTGASGEATDKTETSASAELFSSHSGAGLSWRVEAFKEVTDFEEGRDTEDVQVRAVLTVSPDGELALSGIVGRETNDVLTGQSETDGIAGWRVAWVPGPRTSLSAEQVSRYFGHSHAVSVVHRTARWAFIYTDVADLELGYTPQFGSRGSTYDLLFEQFASREPDPIRREALVSALVETLGVAASVDPFAPSLLTTSAARTRQQRLSVAWLGVRTGALVTAMQGRASQMASLAPASDDFDLSPNIRQRGAGLNIAHRLTPLTSANVLTIWQRTFGDSSAQATTFRSLVVSLSNRLGRHTFASIAARYAQFTSTTDPYEESALVASFRVQF